MLQAHQAARHSDDEALDLSTEQRIHHAAQSTASRFSILKRAFTTDLDHARQASRRFLPSLAEALDEVRFERKEALPPDEQTLHALQAMAPFRRSYLEFFELVIRHGQFTDLLTDICRFFGSLKDCTSTPPDALNFNYLWLDAHRFVVWELFLASTALLIRHRMFAELGQLLDAEFPSRRRPLPGPGSFLDLNSHVRTLDEFRKRRLRLDCGSVAVVQLFRDCQASGLGAEELKQADLVLCVRGLLHGGHRLNRWYPRTLLERSDNSPEFPGEFHDLRQRSKAAPITKALGVRNRDDFVARMEWARSEFHIGKWRLGGRRLDFDQLLLLS